MPCNNVQRSGKGKGVVADDDDHGNNICKDPIDLMEVGVSSCTMSGSSDHSQSATTDQWNHVSLELTLG